MLATSPESLGYLPDATELGCEGPLPTAWNEVRRFPRFYLRTIAKARVFPPPAAEDQTPRDCRILTCDLSRGGLAFLYRSLLFPGQRVDVTLHDKTERSLEVLWCRRIGDGCYWTGGRFLKSDTDAAAGEAGAPGSAAS
jgi:hypothetical protein